jgi:hypothetical protein
VGTRAKKKVILWKIFRTSVFLPCFPYELQADCLHGEGGRNYILYLFLEQTALPVRTSKHSEGSHPLVYVVILTRKTCRFLISSTFLSFNVFYSNPDRLMREALGKMPQYRISQTYSRLYIEKAYRVRLPYASICKQTVKLFSNLTIKLFYKRYQKIKHGLN